MIEVLLPSWLSLSDQVFLPSTLVLAISCLFVTTNSPSLIPASLLYVTLYPSGTAFSLKLYLISVPSLFLSRSDTVALHPLLSFRVNTLPVYDPLASNSTAISSGLNPSRLSSSFHSFLTHTDVLSTL